MKHRHLTMLIPTLVLVGCSSPDERLSRLVRDTTAEQASQNRAVANLNREAAASHQAVVEAVEQSRQELVLLERDLQQQRDRIDGERRDLASERYRESLLGPVLASVGAMLVAALPLVLCWYLLHGIRSQSEDVASEVLIREFVSEHPLLTVNDRQRALLSPEEMQTADDDESPPF